MCGILGIYHSDASKKVNPETVKRATDLMVHRGPDDSGMFVSDNIGLGHRRLSIIDLSLGHQPMFNEDGQIAVVFNGEIYNYKDIQAELVSKGHTFKTNCDTEVIVHAYEEWGTESVKKFIGMFGIALWDNRRKIMWIVRDRLGIKPVYYYWNRNTFICASEIKPLFSAGQVKPEINPKVMDAYCTLGYVPGPETMFKGIMKLKPGHHMVVSGKEIKETEYWDFADITPSEISFENAKRQVDELLHDSVKKRLMSDVPLGVFLSGGLDSSAITAVMHEIVSGPVNTFTVGYDEKYKVGEEYYADIVAKRFNTKHNVFRLEPENFLESIKTLVKYAEEPIVEPAAIALYHISKLAREKSIVLLSGEGSDEVFGGYYLYQFMSKIENMRRFIPGPLLNMAGMFKPVLRKMKYRKYADWLSLSLEKRYMGTSNYLTPSLKDEFYADGFRGERGDYLEETFESYFSKVRHNKDVVNKMLYVDTKTWLVDDLLVKADKMTMAASIELRVPFLDHRLVELAASLPSSYKIRNGEGKYLVKAMMESRLPKEIIYRKKMGFPVPTKNWFGGELFGSVKEILASGHLPWVNGKVVNKMLSQHEAGREDHSKLLMMLLVQSFWQDEYLGRPA